MGTLNSVISVFQKNYYQTHQHISLTFKAEPNNILLHKLLWETFIAKKVIYGLLEL